MKKIRKSKFGFSLLELVIVLAIVVILAAVMVMSIGTYVSNAKAKSAAAEQSRKENNDKDVFDLEVQKTAARAAFYSSFGLCAFVSILSWIFTKRVSVQCWMIFFGMLTVAFGVKFYKMKT